MNRLVLGAYWRQVLLVDVFVHDIVLGLRLRQIGSPGRLEGLHTFAEIASFFAIYAFYSAFSRGLYLRGLAARVGRRRHRLFDSQSLSGFALGRPRVERDLATLGSDVGTSPLAKEVALWRWVAVHNLK